MNCIYNVLSKLGLGIKFKRELLNDMVLDYEFSNNKLHSEWKVGHDWGNYHSDFPYQWYDSESVKIKNEELLLFNRYNPKVINGKLIPYGIGLITSKKKNFSYGYYEIKAQLPDGKNLWPALWLAHSTTWPPEIDIMEDFCDEYGKHSIETNIHYGNNGDTHENIKGLKHRIGERSIKKPINFSCLWTPDKIEFYYDDILVRKEVRKSVLKWFNDNPNMYVILGNGYLWTIQNKPIDKTNYEMKVLNFKYYKWKCFPELDKEKLWIN